MDKSVFDLLNSSDYPDLKEALNQCKDYDEAWSVLKKFETDLDKTIKDLQTSNDEQKLINALHEYNEMKDMTQSVIGSLATLQGVTCAKVHQQFNLLKE